MNDEPQIKPKTGETEFSKHIGDIAKRKLKAQRHVTKTIWSGLGTMGLIGWSIVTPALLGTALGLWLDKHYSSGHSWTLAMLSIGLGLGCLNAWHWVIKEDKEIHKYDDEHDNE